MAEKEQFAGFSKETLTFFRRLKRNNTKSWFDRHRGEYESFVLEPAKAFVVAMGERFHTESVNFRAEPKLNRSIFRIYRDTRFSPDKTPYKTHLALYFWEGMLPRMESPGFYVHVEPSKLLLGAGIYMFSPKQLTRYRKAVVDPEWGQDLSDILTKISRRKDFKSGEKHYKRIPSGFDPDHPNAELLLYNGIHVWEETAIPEEFYSVKFVDYCWKKFLPFLPLHAWLFALSSGKI
ncbi:MAG: DUF2461 domain-containing protein [Candidatus Aminicenantaceae bacterium]